MVAEIDAHAEQVGAQQADHEAVQPGQVPEGFLTATFSAAARAAPLLRSAEGQRDPRAAEGMRQFAAARREELRDLLATGRSRGELAGHADLDLLVDQIYGLLWYRILIGHAPLTAQVATQLTRQLTGR